MNRFKLNGSSQSINRIPINLTENKATPKPIPQPQLIPATEPPKKAKRIVLDDTDLGNIKEWL